MGCSIHAGGILHVGMDLSPLSASSSLVHCRCYAKEMSLKELRRYSTSILKRLSASLGKARVLCVCMEQSETK